MLVEVLDVHGHVQMRHRVSGVGGQCRIGRSLACDLTIDDACTAPEHALLTLQEGGLTLVQDLGSRNGVRLDGRLIGGAGRSMANGELLVGRTRIRIRTQDGVLPPERLFRRDLLRRYRTPLALTGVALCLAFAAFLQWLGAPDALPARVLVAELLTLAGLAIWVAVWSLVSRLTLGAWQVRIHLAIAALCVGCCVWWLWLYQVTAFALQWRWLGLVAAAGAAAIAVVAAFLHLRNATHFQRLSSLLLALLVPLLWAGMLWLVDLQVDPRTVNRVEMGVDIQPPTMRLAASMDLGDYLADAAALKREANRNRQVSLLETPVLDAND